MIISHSHKFIFVHARKVAGGSIEAYLSRFLDKDDFVYGSLVDRYQMCGVTPTRKMWKDLRRPKALSAFMYRALARLAMNPWSGLNQEILIDSLNFSRKAIYRSFNDASKIRTFAPYEWDNYYKFAFVRNPYDRAVSDYKWRTRGLTGGRVHF